MPIGNYLGRIARKHINYDKCKSKLDMIRDLVEEVM